MNQSRLRVFVGGALLLAFVATACGGSDDGGSNSTSASSGTAAAGSPASAAALTIADSAFSEASVTAGTEFTIANEDGRTHTVTDDAGAFDVEVPAGGTAPLTIDAPGTYKIHCRIHGSMHGTITVT